MEKKDKLVLSVSDNGSGIPTQEIRHIFQQGYRNAANGRQGHGLGLAYVRRIVRQYGGSIRVESRENEGTGFRISLNLKKRKSGHAGTGIYSKIFVGMLITEAIWMYNLYDIERKNFCTQQKEYTKAAVDKLSVSALHWCDSAQFRNNWDDHTVTVTRGKGEVTIPLSGLHSGGLIRTPRY